MSQEGFFSSNNSSQASRGDMNLPDMIDLPHLSNEKIAELQKAFNKYQKVAEEAEEVEPQVGLTEQEQLAQSGDLIEFYNGDWRYRLLAIVYPEGNKQALGQPMALVRAKNIKDKQQPTKIDKIEHGKNTCWF